MLLDEDSNPLKTDTIGMKFMSAQHRRILKGKCCLLVSRIYAPINSWFRKYHLAFLIVILCFILWDELKALYLISQMKTLNEFQYPQYGDIYKHIENYERNNASGWKDVPPYEVPINFLQYELTNFDPEIHRSDKGYRIINLVKSNVNNYENRAMIRKTWGNPNCTFNREAKVRVFFIMGELPQYEKSKEPTLTAEGNKYKDILRYNLIDSYYNNTYKLMVAFDLFYKRFPEADYLIITDDDYFIHPPNLFDHINRIHPRRYPFYVGGGVWYNAQPIRGGDKKWRISMEDYPFNHFPDYPTGGNLIISLPMARLLSIGFQVVKYMAFDDVLLGILMFKLGIAPENIRSMCKSREECDPNRIENVISSHGFRNPAELQVEWDLHRFYEFCR